MSWDGCLDPWGNMQAKCIKMKTFASLSTFHKSLHSALLTCKTGSIYLTGKEARTELQETGNRRTPKSNALQGSVLQSPQHTGYRMSPAILRYSPKNP